jgi:hypothetical protein
MIEILYLASDGSNFVIILSLDSERYAIGSLGLNLEVG